MCPLRGRWGLSFQEKGCPPCRGRFFPFGERGMRPPFLFLPTGEKETRICALRAALRAVALRNAAAAAGARCKEKEGPWVADLLEPRFYFTLQFGRTLCGLVPGSHTGCSIDRAPRWCGRKVSCVQICTEMILHCAASRVCACAVLGKRAVRSAFFVVGRLFQCAGMHYSKLVLRCFSFRCC